MNNELPIQRSLTETINLHAETVEIQRLAKVKGEVKVSVETRTREHLVDETLTNFRAHVEHVVIDRFVDEMPGIRMEGETTVIPVVEEVLVRRLLLKEEVRVSRVAVSHPHRETVVLRYQDVVVSRTPSEELVPSAAGSVEPL